MRMLETEKKGAAGDLQIWPGFRVGHPFTINDPRKRTLRRLPRDWNACLMEGVDE